MSFLANARATVAAIEPRLLVGSVHALRGLTLVVDRLRVPVGSLVEVNTGIRTQSLGEVIGFEGPRSLVMLYGASAGVAPGAAVRAVRSAPTVAIGRSWLGRTVNALGTPIDEGPPLDELEPRLLEPGITNPLSRRIIDEPLPTGVRAIDALLTVGRGQRMGIFAGPGVGKSTLLANIAKGAAADIAVIGLVGERGREVKEFIEHTLGSEGRRRAVLVVATGDESPLLRVRAASVAVAAAEYFRDEGANVVLMIDSVTRLAHAQRQIGLAAGEQPATKGYTPSVFALLPRLLERAGPLDGRGSITGFYTVLVEGDDMTEPVADAVKGILDGHIVLSRRIATRGHYPAIDPLESISRVADQITDANHQKARREMIRLLAAWREHEEIISIGAYARGANPDVDCAIAMRQAADAFLRQGKDERSDYPRTLRSLIEFSLAAESFRQRAPVANAAAAQARPAQAAPTQPVAPKGR
ncbi:MAG: FliI/YscN family ATPase [Phycisphaerales bacterium]